MRATCAGAPKTTTTTTTTTTYPTDTAHKIILLSRKTLDYQIIEKSSKIL